MLLRHYLSAFLILAFHCLYAHDLIEVRLVNPRIQVDMRYATTNNVIGKEIYPFPGCFLVREVAEKLSRVQQELEKEGYGLKILDAYRPYSMQPLLCIEEGEKRSYFTCGVEDEDGHNRGTSVDVTLVCLSGYELEMPSDFGDTSDRAKGDCRTHSGHVFHNKCKLEQAMQRQGFYPSPNEWWHFDYCGYSCYPILDVKFEELVNFQKPTCW